MKILTVEGRLESAGPAAWRIEQELLKPGTVLELCLGGGWLLGLLQLSADSVCRFLSWEDGVEINLRPGLRARALKPTYE
jgi:hypothetical protein